MFSIDYGNEEMLFSVMKLMSCRILGEKSIVKISIGIDHFEGSVLLASHALLSDVWIVLWIDKRF